MKFLLLTLSLISTTWVQTDLEKVRASFKLAPQSEKEADKLIEMLSGISGANHAVYRAYLGAVTTMKASWAFWPNQKLEYANKGMKILNAAVTADPGNIEIRWLRFSVETQMPSFLGYDHQKEDKTVIYQSLKSESYLMKNDLRWVREIAAFMKKFAQPTSAELKVLHPYLN